MCGAPLTHYIVTIKWVWGKIIKRILKIQKKKIVFIHRNKNIKLIGFETNLKIEEGDSAARANSEKTDSLWKEIHLYTFTALKASHLVFISLNSQTELSKYEGRNKSNRVSKCSPNLPG